MRVFFKMPASTIVLICMMSSAPALAQPGTQPTDRPFTAQLIAEADALVDVVVQRGYGWAWGDGNDSGASSDPRRAPPVPVGMAPLTTPAAGLVLFWTGKLLDDERYIHASQEAARGVAAAMENTGRVPARAVFGPAPISEDASSAVPDRAPTCAALGLLLTLQAEQKLPDERTRRAVIQAANWLARQQTHSGAWPTAWPPDALPNDALRIICLDNRDYRDSTLTMLLASQVLETPIYSRSVQRAIDQLLALRVDERGVAVRGLWRAMYTLDGSFPNKIADASPDIDILATRFSLQTIFGGYLLSGRSDWGKSFNDAVKAIETLRQPDGKWDRRYAGRFSGQRAATQPGVFDVPAAREFGVENALRMNNGINALGREEYLSELEHGFLVREHLAQMVSGLSDASLTLEFPRNAEAREAYVKQNEQMWHQLESPVPEDLPTRVRRLWILYIRARLENR